MDGLLSFFARTGLLPHAYCVSGNPALLWSGVGSDLLIAGAYFSIPLAIMHFVRRRGEREHNALAWLFSAFIFACGITHVMDVWTVWQPDYGAQVLAKGVTAALSIVTAVALWPLIPRALAIPSVTQLRSAIGALETEIQLRRTVEEHLQDIEQNLAVTLASIGAGFVATDRRGQVTRMNAVAEQVTGWTQSEARGHSLWEVLVREDRPAGMLQRNPVEVMVERGVDIDTPHQVVVVARDGRRTSVELKAALTRADDGTVRGLGMVFRDLTAEQAAEVERSRLAAIVESSNDVIIGKTLNGVIVSWNRAAEALFGYTAWEAIGQRVQMLLPPDREAEEMRILANLAHGLSVPPFETVRRAKDGSLVDVSVTISPIRDAAGRVVGGSKIARDIRAQKQAEQNRQKAERLEAENREIQESNRLKSQFLANMSHELRTPLNAIIGFAELLRSSRVADPAKQQRFLDHIGTSGRHLLQLINDILDLSKVESGRFEFFPEAVDLPRLVGEVGNVLQMSFERKRLDFTVDIDTSIGPLQLDPARLKQVLYNFLSNAVKFTPEGGAVTVRARPEGAAHFRLEVADTGTGIAAADLPRLFVEFQQLDAGTTKQHPGTGLGLALTRRLVQAQGGSVGVSSTPGQGSVFHLVLPRAHDVGTPAAAAAHRVLVIEDDLRVQAQVRQALVDAGFRVDAASSGDQALAHARSRTYDAISLDLMLPDRRGLGVLAEIRDEGPNRAAPVLSVSLPGGGGEAASFAVADVLSKPIRTAEVLVAVGRLQRPAGRDLRVMVVDDDPLALDLMRATLAGIGVEVICVTGGRQALHEIDRHRPDAIVLDLMMPEFDGFETLDALRRLPRWQDTPVFVWTSMILTEPEYASLARSAQSVLGKGGGALAEVLAAIARWRPPQAAASDSGGS